MKRRTKLASKIDETRDIDDKGKVTFGGDVEVDGKITSAKGGMLSVHYIGTDKPIAGQDYSIWNDGNVNNYRPVIDVSNTSTKFKAYYSYPCFKTSIAGGVLTIGLTRFYREFDYATNTWNTGSLVPSEQYSYVKMTLSQYTHVVTITSSAAPYYLICTINDGIGKEVDSVTYLAALIGNNTIEVRGYYKADGIRPTLLQSTGTKLNVFYKAASGAGPTISLPLDESDIEIQDRVRKSSVAVVVS